MLLSATAKLSFEKGSWLELIRDVIMGTSIGLMHPITLVRKWFYAEVLIPWLNQTFGFNIQKDSVVHSKDGEKTLKVVAVGYGRTGTYSLTMALEEMGFPMLHTQHLYENHALFDMWNEEVFLPSIRTGKTIMGKPDLQMIASFGYQGTADLPMALYFEQVMEEYPDCKFILTTRDNSDVWFSSWDRLTQAINPPAQRGGNIFNSCQKLTNYFAWLYSHINKDEHYLTQPHPFPRQDPVEAKKSYEEHNRRVRATVPKDRLLEYSVKQGWEPLCQFMEIPDGECPTTPFPRSNSIRSVAIQAFVATWIAPLLVTVAIVHYLFHRSGRRSCKVD